MKFLDVKTELKDGTKVIIEMQVLNVEGFEKRVLYNAAKSYSIQLEKGDQYDLLNPIIAVTITDFIMFEGMEKVMSYFKLIEKELLIQMVSRLIKLEGIRIFRKKSFLGLKKVGKIK